MNAAKARPRKPAPPDTCRLTLFIRGDAYSVRPFSTPDGRAVSLRKSGASDPYTVAETPHGLVCDCADFAWRHEGRDAVGYKHCRALVAVGLISPLPGVYALYTPSSEGLDSSETPSHKPGRASVDCPTLTTNEGRPAPAPTKGLTSSKTPARREDTRQMSTPLVSAPRGVISTDDLSATKPSRPAINGPTVTTDDGRTDSAPSDDPDDLPSDPADWPAWTDGVIYSTTRRSL